MVFEGFDALDFAVFELPTFEARMPALRERLTPKMRGLGEDLLPALRKMLGEELHAHTAQHLRRRTNPPEATWVAFSPSRKAYKPFTHYRVSISASGLRCVVFEEDYADEKLQLAAGLRENAEELAGLFRQHTTLTAFDLGCGKQARGPDVTAQELLGLAARLESVAGQHAAFGFEHPPARVIGREPEQVVKRLLEDARRLIPFYRVGREPGLRL